MSEDESTPTGVRQPRIAWEGTDQGGNVDSPYSTWETGGGSTGVYNGSYMESIVDEGATGGGVISFESNEESLSDLKEQLIVQRHKYEGEIEKLRHQLQHQSIQQGGASKNELEDLREQLRIEREKNQEYEQEILYKQTYQSGPSFPGDVSTQPSVINPASVSPAPDMQAAGPCSRCEELQQSLSALDKRHEEELVEIRQELETSTGKYKRELADMRRELEKAKSGKKTTPTRGGLDAQRQRKLVEAHERLKNSEVKREEAERKVKELEAELHETKAECQENEKVSHHVTVVSCDISPPPHRTSRRQVKSLIRY